MRSTLRQFVRSPHRQGFTLVELLVALSIFVILVTLTVGGFRATVEADRATNAASTMRNAFEGARSRAVKSTEIRGIRLMAAPNNPRIATSYVYIGSAGTQQGAGGIKDPADDLADGTIAYLGYYVGEEDTNGNAIWDGADDDDSDGVQDRAGWYFCDSSNPTYFQDLYLAGLLNPGNRIRFSVEESVTSTAGNPDPIFDNQPWYTIRYIEYDINGNGSLDSIEDTNNNGLLDVQLVEFFQPMTNGDNANNYRRYNQSLVSTIPSTLSTIYYQVELSPMPLPGAEPVAFPRGACIDLDASRLPAGWRFSEDTNGNGSLDGSESDLNGSGAFEFSVGYTTNMDLLFTPQGSMVGSLASEGVLHFVIASIEDVDAFQNNTSTGRTRALGGSFPVGTEYPYPDWWIQADASKDRKVLSIFTQSGSSLITDVYTPGDSNNKFNDEALVGFNPADSLPWNPFRNALRGKESKQ